MKKTLKKFLKTKKGQGLVEWIMILALILVAVMALLGQIGSKAKSKASDILVEMDTTAT